MLRACFLFCFRHFSSLSCINRMMFTLKPVIRGARNKPDGFNVCSFDRHEERRGPELCTLQTSRLSGGPGRIRTYDQAIMSRLRYRCATGPWLCYSSEATYAASPVQSSPFNLPVMGFGVKPDRQYAWSDVAEW